MNPYLRYPYHDRTIRKSLRKLELDNVLAQLADCANSEDGKAPLPRLLPLDDAEEIRLLQQQTTAACGMIVRRRAGLP